jgi:hypothetical protein
LFHVLAGYCANRSPSLIAINDNNLKAFTPIEGAEVIYGSVYERGLIENRNNN